MSNENYSAPILHADAVKLRGDAGECVDQLARFLKKPHAADSMDLHAMATELEETARSMREAADAAIWDHITEGAA